MKLPLVSRKKYEMERNNNKINNEARAKLRLEYINIQKTNNALNELNRELGNQSSIDAEKIKELKKEVKRLKMLLTNNGIDYSKKKVR